MPQLFNSVEDEQILEYIDCLWSDFTNSLSTNLLSEGLNTVHSYLYYTVSACFIHMGGGGWFGFFLNLGLNVGKLN